MTVLGFFLSGDDFVKMTFKFCTVKKTTKKQKPNSIISWYFRFSISLL